VPAYLYDCFSLQKPAEDKRSLSNMLMPDNTPCIINQGLFKGLSFINYGAARVGRVVRLSLAAEFRGPKIECFKLKKKLYVINIF
jgi:hypothetical protein